MWRGQGALTRAEKRVRQSISGTVATAVCLHTYSLPVQVFTDIWPDRGMG
jgi:hypothetical protein